MAQWVKEPALSLQQLVLLMGYGFGPWPGNLHIQSAWPKKKKNRASFKASTDISGFFFFFSPFLKFVNFLDDLN